MDVTDVLRNRMQEPSGFQQMAVVSVLVHAVVVAIFVVAPGRWSSQVAQAPRAVMTITLGAGAPGPDSGGRTDIGGRAVQEALPPDVKRAPATPPAAKPEMTMPVPGKTAPRATPTAAVKSAPEGARGRTPSKGAEVVAGSTPVDIPNVRGQGFGLSTSSGGSGEGVRLDVLNFCCPEYIELMNQRIRQNWDSKAETPSQLTLFFIIQRDGTLSDVKLEQSSGSSQLDLRAQSAIARTRQLPPLPSAFTGPTLPVHLTFKYIR